MKSFFLTCILILGLTSAKAQGYESIFGDSSTQWNVAEEFVDAGYMTLTYTIEDTITINNHFYRKINRWGSTDFAVREDTATGRLYIYDLISNQEWLIGDLSLSIGDSLKIDGFGYPLSLSGYSSVDSVYFESNRKHIRFDRWVNWQQLKKLELIEGVGPNAGLLYTIMGSSILVCAHKDGNLTFADSAMFNFGPCQYGTVGLEEDLKKSEIKVYPNPSSDLITFALDNFLNERVTITILDRLGRTVQEVTSTLNNPGVNTAEMPGGIYFYRLAVNGKPLASGKISVSN